MLAGKNIFQYSNTKELYICKRREAVADLRLKGKTFSQITELLPSLGIINLNTDRPYSCTIIVKDVKIIEKEWNKINSTKINKIRSKKYSELEQIKNLAIEEQKYDSAINAIKAQCKLYNLYTDTTVNIQNNLNVAQPPTCNVIIESTTNDIIDVKKLS